MGEPSNLHDHSSYEAFFVRSDTEQYDAAAPIAQLGHICVDSRGLVDVPDFSVQTPGDIRSIAIATQVALGESHDFDHNEVTRAVAEHLDWFGHNGCKFRKLMSSIIAPIVEGNETVRANSLKIGMGLLTDDMFEQIQRPLTKLTAQPERTKWQHIEHPQKFVNLQNAENKASLYIANGVPGEYFQSGEAYKANRSAFVQTSGQEIIRLGESLRTAFPIDIDRFAGTLAMLGGSTAHALDAEVVVRETSLATAA